MKNRNHTANCVKKVIYTKKFFKNTMLQISNLTMLIAKSSWK